jgi:hypothetical protein
MLSKASVERGVCEFAVAERRQQLLAGWAWQVMLHFPPTETFWSWLRPRAQAAFRTNVNHASRRWTPPRAPGRPLLPAPPPLPSPPRPSWPQKPCRSLSCAPRASPPRPMRRPSRPSSGRGGRRVEISSPPQADTMQAQVPQDARQV